MPSPTKHLLSLNLLLVLLLVLLPPTTTALRLNLYTGQKCTGQALGSWTGGPRQGCQTLFAGQATSAIVRNGTNNTNTSTSTSKGGVDVGVFEEVVFFRGGKCETKMEIVRSGSQKEGGGCVRAVGYGSFRVREVRSGKMVERAF